MGTPYLVKRRAGWYIRIRTPADLRRTLGEHIVRTLRTSDLTAARGRALRVAAGMPGIWHEVRSEAVKILGRDIDELGHGLLASAGASFHLAGTLRADTWNGTTTVQLTIDDAAPAR